MRSKFPFLIIGLLSATIFAQQQQQKPANDRVGLAAVLADDEKVIAELSKRELSTLRDYMFERNHITKEQQAAYLAVSSVRQLGDSKLTRKQQQDLIHNVALGIDK